MNRPRMSRAASALHRQLLGRAGAEANRIFLSSWVSTDWQSLTFSGERHQISFVVSGDRSAELARRWTEGVSDAEYAIPQGFVADIGLAGELALRDDGATLVELEALTLAD